MELIVNLGPDTYPIYIENGILPQTGSYIRKFFTGKKSRMIMFFRFMERLSWIP